MKLGELLYKVIQTLKQASIENPQFEALLILSYVLNLPKSKVVTEPNIELSASDVESVERVVSKRVKRIPLAYILKRKEFFGLEFYIEEGVLIPRPETELLVEEVLNRIPTEREVVGFEVGVGSGCICVSLMCNRKNLKMVCIDVSEKAIEISKINAQKHGVSDRLSLVKSSILSNPDFHQKFDFVVSNPPYIREDEYENLMEEVKFEPKEALISGKEGTEFYEKISTWAKRHLKKGGFVALEIGIGQLGNVSDTLKSSGFGDLTVYTDLQGIERVIIGYNLED